MKTIVCQKPHHFEQIEVPVPKPQQDEALVRIRRIGICGTDLHAYRGKQPFFTYPRVLGHELAGEIVELPSPADHLQIGDQVAIIPYLHCGQCFPCRMGKTNCCTELKVLGVHTDGGMCEYITVPTSHLLPTKELTIDQTAIIEPLSIGAHAVRRAKISEGDVVLVIGAGPIGLAVMKYAKLAGARLIAMDVVADRLQYCKSWVPADHTINASVVDPMEALAEITNEDFPVTVMDATGNKQSMMRAYDYVAHGGQLVYVGLVRDDISFYDPDFHKKELTLLGSRNATRADFDYVIESIRSGTVDTASYITHHATFDELIDRFDTWLQPDAGVIKALVHC